MRVAIDAVGIRSGGGAVLLLNFLRWLPIVRPNWRFHVFLLPRRSREFRDPVTTNAISIEYVESDWAPSRLRWLVTGLSRRLSSLRADVLFSFANAGISNSPIPQIVYCQQRLAVSTGTGQYLGSQARLRMALLRRLILRGCRNSQSVIVQTESMRRDLLRLDQSLNSRIRVIPAGWSASSSDGLVAPRGWTAFAAKHSPKLTFVSNSGLHKNHEILLMAMPRILSAFPQAGLCLTLDSPDVTKQSSSQSDVIGRSARRLGIEQHVALLGTLPHEQAQFVLSHADVQVFPSLAESFGIPLLEAMVLGCPLVAADLPYAHDVAGDSALYFRATDAQQLADAVILLLNNERLRRELTECGKRRAEAFHYRYVSESIAEVMEGTAGRLNGADLTPRKTA